MPTPFSDQWFSDVGSDIYNTTFGDQPGEAAAKALGVVPKDKAAPKPKAKSSTSEASEPQNLSEFAQSLAGQYLSQTEEEIGSEGAQLANENQAVTAAIAPLLAGQGASPGNDAVQAAMDAYSKAYATGEGVQSAAYQQMGVANQQYLSAAPEQAFLQLLSQPGTEYYKEIPQGLLSQLPESLQYSLSVAGVPNVAVPKGGWPKSLTGGSGGVANNAISSLGATPASEPGTLGTGNPATPGS